MAYLSFANNKSVHIMKIKFNKDFKIFKTGDEIAIRPNEVNYLVGLNGCGKSVITSSLADHIYKSFTATKKKQQRHNWMTCPPDYIRENFSFEGFESITDITFYTAKHRQSQFVDLDQTFDHPSSIACLRISEGMNNQSELVEAFKCRSDKNRLFIFDEIDGTLDIRAKCLFFDRLLPSLSGTAIVCSHETLLIREKDVYDLSSNKQMKMVDYFTKHSTFV